MKNLKLAALVLSLSGVTALGAGCSDNYSYFTVHVKLASSVKPDAQERIQSCTLYVFYNGGDEPIESSGALVRSDGSVVCQTGQTPRDLGTFNYSSARSSGTLDFWVDMRGNDVDKAGALVTNLVLAQGHVSGELSPGSAPKELPVMEAETCGDCVGKAAN